MNGLNHTAGTKERLALRLRAVQAVADGEKKAQVARRFGITRQTLHAWVVRHRSGGPDALAPRPRGRKRLRLLEPWQEEQVLDAILLQPPRAFGLPYSCWTRKAIAGLVEASFGVSLSTWLVGSCIRRCGFQTPKEVRRAFAHGERQPAHGERPLPAAQPPTL